ncbi:MAG: alpha-amylase family glycosyl hydrolase [Candidatus Merdivicinus sp.]|jgi:1,4-alpha-glucan branching enzyme
MSDKLISEKKSSLKILQTDPALAPFAGDLQLRMHLYHTTRNRLAGDGLLADFANGSLYYGFQPGRTGWYYREWAPGAEKMSLVGDFNDWDPTKNPMKKLKNGNWEVFVRGKNTIPHGSFVKVRVTSHGRSFDRIPLYIHRIHQFPDGSCTGQFWNPADPYQWQYPDFSPSPECPLLIYETHIGMATEREGIGTYREFTQTVLPRIQKEGYNTIQLMAIMEHPYYASFGYQVTNFFAASSRFGTPEELKELIDTAHGMGIAVLLDLVHSHACPNTNEGINDFDGTDYQFFHAGEKGNHPAWGTKLFNYGKNEVLHFLLSNLKYWLDEYHFDGFRFDGVTSMLYHHHGLGEAFDSYEKYFTMATDTEAVTYLQLANALIREVKPSAITIAEDMSGMPGMCRPIEEGGIGFDYRLAMGVPDFWIKTLTSKRDEDWDLGQMWYQLTTRRPGEPNIGYCESHDQALVGDKTIMFRLADKEMYWHMDNASNSPIIERAIAYHKLIRLVTGALAGEGYLNFMGNEFGHPEWIDFPREGNNWSYQHARRQWSLADNGYLRYRNLLWFDEAMIALLKELNIKAHPAAELEFINHDAKLMVFHKGGYTFAFNFNPTRVQRLSLATSCERVCPILLNTEWQKFGGHLPDGPESRTVQSGILGKYIDITLPPRSAVVFR